MKNGLEKENPKRQPWLRLIKEIVDHIRTANPSNLDAEDDDAEKAEDA